MRAVLARPLTRFVAVISLAVSAVILGTTIAAPGSAAGREGKIPRLGIARSFAGGALRFNAAPPNEQTARSKTMAVRTARKELASGTAAPTPEVFFALYNLETTERVPSGSAHAVRQVRRVWVVRFPRVGGRRRSEVILRANLPTIVPITTIAPNVTTDVLVVVDDQTGVVLLRSEFAPEQPAVESPSSTPGSCCRRSP